METETAQSNVAIATSKRENRPEQTVFWLIDAVTLLAESFGEPLTSQRIEIYARDLADLQPDELRAAFTRARRELKFFPKIAELRDLAGANAEDTLKVDAEAAWHFANRYLDRHGVVKCDRDDRPPLPPQVDYALRRIGGLWALNQMTSESRPFMYRDFCEAYKLAPTAELLVPQLADKLCARRLLGEVKELTSAQCASEQPSEAKPSRTPWFRSKPMPAPMTDTEVRDRREMLKQHTERFRSANSAIKSAG
jgi:hypothetical protein